MWYQIRVKFIAVFIASFLMSCSGQEQEKNTVSNQLVGGGCEGCEAVFEYGNRTLISIDTLPKFHDAEAKLKISGTVFHRDGITPASNVILYIYQTNKQGVYETKGDERGWAKRHGFIRGWIQTELDGKYAFYTFRPTAYPNGQEPQHIHVVVKEEGKNEYFIDNFLFANDSLLTNSIKSKLENRGGSGIVDPITEGELSIVERNIILGLNIPNYD